MFNLLYISSFFTVLGNMGCGNVTLKCIQMMILFTLWVLTRIKIGFMLM